MPKDKVTFEISWLNNDSKWLLRVMRNGISVFAPRRDSVKECLEEADSYCQEYRSEIRSKVIITVNY